VRVQSPRSQVQSQRQRKSRAKRSLSSDVGLWTLGFGLSVLLALTGCRRGSDGLSEPVSSSPLSVGLSTNFVRVGDVFQLTLTSILPPSDTLAAPDLARGKEVVVRNREEKKHTLPDGRTQTTWRYDLTSFVVGNHNVSTGVLQIIHSDGTSTALPFPTAEFAVRSMLVDSNAPLRDIKDLEEWPGAFPRWLAGVLLISVLALLAAVAVHRLLTKPRTILHYAPPPPPHETALNELKRLRAKGWIESENAEPFYVELSSIIRRYLENRFGLRAPERTTEEFIREASTSRLLSSDHQMLTCEFLEQCDLVKFARHRPRRADMQSGYDAAERLVRETIPHEPSTTDHSP